MNLWVVKIGTSLLRGSEKLTTANVIDIYCSSIAECKKRGDKVVLVTSGAVGLGCDLLKINERPQDIVSLQATAAIGQGHLMALYEASMKQYGYKVAQILLTRSDLGSRNSYRNASMTLKQLLDWGVLPIVNENDTLSSEELRYGDNDTLSALVAVAINANQLILLTDIDRLYSSDPKINATAKPILDIHHPNEIRNFRPSSNTKTTWGTGGISTKLDAAQIATKSGITVHLADGREPKALKDLLKGTRGGTVFHPHPEPISNRKTWLANALKPLGSIHIDKGACNAIKEKGASLLLVGINKVEGQFSTNQPVTIINTEGEELARGLSSLGSEDINKALKKDPLNKKSLVVIHRDLLVLTDQFAT